MSVPIRTGEAQTGGQAAAPRVPDRDDGDEKAEAEQAPVRGDAQAPARCAPLHRYGRLDFVVVVVWPGAVVLRGREEREDIPEEGNPNMTMNKAFVEAVRSGDSSGILCPYDEGMRTFELTYAAHISATEQRLVHIGEALPLLCEFGLELADPDLGGRVRRGTTRLCGRRGAAIKVVHKRKD